MEELQTTEASIDARRGPENKLRLVIAVIGVLTIAKAALDASTGLEVVDLWMLSEIGSGFFGSDWMYVFSDEIVQVGPVTLFVQGLLWELAGATDIPLELLFSLLVQPLVVAACLALVGAGISDKSARWRAYAVVGGFLLVWEIPWNAYAFGHPTEFLIPILWLFSARFAREGRGEWAGLLVALSAGLKLWGALGFPLLLLAPGIRAVVRGGAVGAGTLALLYGPFFLLGEVNTFDYRWIVGAGTGVSWVMAEGARFGWLPRLVQGGLALAAGAAVSLRGRGAAPLFVWAPALAIIGTRLALDPTAFPYYWLAAQAVLLVSAGWLVGARAPLAAALLLLVALVTFFAAQISVVGISLLVIMVAVAAAAFGDRLDLTWVPLRRPVRAG